MCKLSTCCLFLLIQFFWHFCFCCKIFNVYANRNTPKAHRKTQAFAATLSHLWTGAQVWSMLFPGISSTALVRCGFFQPACYLVAEKKTSCKPEIQATISHLVDLFWSSISHQQSSSYMNYPKTIPTSRFHKAMMMLRGPAPSAGRAWVKAFHIRPSKPWSKVTWTAWHWWAKRYLEDIFYHLVSGL